MTPLKENLAKASYSAAFLVAELEETNSAACKENGPAVRLLPLMLLDLIAKAAELQHRIAAVRDIIDP